MIQQPSDGLAVKDLPIPKPTRSYHPELPFLILLFQLAFSPKQNTSMILATINTLMSFEYYEYLHHRLVGV